MDCYAAFGMPARDPQTDSIPRPRALGLGIDMGPFVAPPNEMRKERRDEEEHRESLNHEKAFSYRKVVFAASNQLAPARCDNNNSKNYFKLY